MRAGLGMTTSPTSSIRVETYTLADWAGRGSLDAKTSGSCTGGPSSGSSGSSDQCDHDESGAKLVRDGTVMAFVVRYFRCCACNLLVRPGCAEKVSFAGSTAKRFGKGTAAAAMLLGLLLVGALLPEPRLYQRLIPSPIPPVPPNAVSSAHQLFYYESAVAELVGSYSDECPQ